MAVRTWVWVTLAVVAIMITGCLAVVGTTVYMVSRQVQVSETSPEAADAEMAKVLERFEGERPLLEMRPGGMVTQAEMLRRAASYQGELPTHLHILGWDAHERHLVRLSIPFWLMNLAPGGGYQVRLSEESGAPSFRIDPEDLQRAGPALVMDHRDGDERFLVWTE